MLGLADTPTDGVPGLSGFCAYYDQQCHIGFNTGLLSFQHQGAQLNLCTSATQRPWKGQNCRCFLSHNKLLPLYSQGSGHVCEGHIHLQVEQGAGIDTVSG